MTDGSAGRLRPMNDHAPGERDEAEIHTVSSRFCVPCRAGAPISRPGIAEDGLVRPRSVNRERIRTIAAYSPESSSSILASSTSER
ncbi:hypothetical protein B8V81_4686 [Paenibacillus pasadenensis]|uniref:Uncharacterized protein n=1 Tax=Paenibacillus pasadenensis TaxID=217090 RepID=A0A2N5N7F6_9BACL|nr:hypothetical protein B8V81_4686 [Paenibacillus pasadenensis]